MNFLPAQIEAYATDHTTDESLLLKKINRDTHAEVLMPRMVSGHLQGRVLATISKLLRPRTILEIGTYTGYATICLAEGLQKNGKLITLDINEELETRVRGYLQEAGLSNTIDYRIGNALNIIPTLTDNFDLVFIDADKENYSSYYDLIFDKVSIGGILLADNVLWSGKVVGDKEDKDTKAIKQFNDRIMADKRVENVLLPIRDGIMLIRKLTN